MTRRFKKILEIGPIAPPLQGWSVRIHYLLQAMRAEGIDCAALDIGENRKIARPECDTVGSSLSYAWKVLRYLSCGYRIHTHLNGQSVKGYILALYATLLSCLFFRPAVLTWHAGVNQKFFPLRKGWLADWTNTLVFRLSRSIICNTSEVKDKIVEYGVAPHRVHAIQAFSRQYLEFEPATVPRHLEECIETANPLIFCYLAFRPEFSVEVLRDALRELAVQYPGMKVILASCGEAPESIRDEFETAGLSEVVCFTGNLERPLFLTLLTRAQLVIRTPARDGISSSVLEALALGVPVVAAANSLRPPQVIQYEGSEPADLVAKVGELMEKPPEQRRPTPPEIPDTILDEINVLTGNPA